MDSINIWVRRLILVAISLVLGFIVTYIWVVKLEPPIGLSTTLDDYTPLYTVLTTLSLGMVFAIWLDLFMKTKILPN